MSDDINFKLGRWALVGGIGGFALGVTLVVSTEQPVFFLLMLAGVYLGYRVDRRRRTRTKDKELAQRQAEDD